MNHLNTSSSSLKGISPSSADAVSTYFATNYAGIIAFVAVATEGSFAKAGERLGIGRSAVSRNIQKLETQLSTRLFLRTTRATRLTGEGQRFFENCSLGVRHIVDAVNEMLNLRHGPPCGVLRISSPVAFGRKVVAPLLPKFTKAYPDIKLELLLSDHAPDLASGQIDVAFRNGCIEDSSIIAKHLVPMLLVLCASPSYIERRGLPSSICDLDRHDCINLRYSNGRISEWEFEIDGLIQGYLPKAKLTFNDADLVLNAALDGHGIAQLGGYQICDHIARGGLVTIFPRHGPDGRGHYICYMSRQHLPTRTRVFIDFMTEEIRDLDLRCFEGSDIGGSNRSLQHR
ncbi:LysR family transcriptional regulator [Cupriavidus sp. RAF12]|uniref:LysR family transcriptional regulator n=1 Tax=Cupriavidus sp. RAF12 TaxID=3233050 RepID=UPI003F91995F